MSNNNFEVVDWTNQNNRGMSVATKKRHNLLEKKIRSHPFVKEIEKNELLPEPKSLPLHFSLKFIILYQVFLKMDKLIKEAEFSNKNLIEIETILDMDKSRETPDFYKNQIIEKLTLSGMELKNNKNRSGNYPINIFIAIESIIVKIEHHWLKKNPIKIHENIIDFIIWQCSKVKSIKSKIATITTTIENLIHPMDDRDLDDMIEFAKIQLESEELKKMKEAALDYILLKRVKELTGPTILERIRALHQGVLDEKKSKGKGKGKSSGRSSGSNSGSNSSAGPAGKKTKGKKTKGKNTKGKNTKGKNTKSKNTKSKNTKSKNTKSKNTKSKNTKSKNTKSKIINI